MPQVVGIDGGTLGAREAYSNALADTHCEREDLLPYSVFDEIIELASNCGLVWHLDSELPAKSYLLSHKNTISALVQIKFDGMVTWEAELEERPPLTQHQAKLHLERVQATSLKLANLISVYGAEDIVTPSIGIPKDEFVRILTELGKYRVPSRAEQAKAFLKSRREIGPPSPTRAQRLNWFFEGKRKLRLRSSIADLQKIRKERPLERTDNWNDSSNWDGANVDQLEYAAEFNASALDRSRDFVATSVLLIALVATRQLDYLRESGGASSGIWSFLQEVIYLVVRDFENYRGTKDPIEDIGGLFRRAKSAASERLAKFDAGTEDEEDIY